ncbi:MAG: hypothetical protein JW931_08250 [Methanomicrobiaceae archaeon]|nr:hypothetical protein [Methanomicrobiaceae archaeon]
MKNKILGKLFSLVILLSLLVISAEASGSDQSGPDLAEKAGDLLNYILGLSFKILTGEISEVSPDDTFRQDWEDDTAGFKAGLGADGCSPLVDDYVGSAQSSYSAGYDAMNAGIVQLLGFHDYPNENQEMLINSYIDQAEAGLLDADDNYNRAREGCSVTSSNLFTFNMVGKKLDVIIDDFYYIKIKALRAVEYGKEGEWDLYYDCIEEIDVKLKTIRRLDNEVRVFF